MSLQHQNRDHTFPFSASTGTARTHAAAGQRRGEGGHRGSAPRWVLVSSGRDCRSSPVTGSVPRRGGTRLDQHCAGQRCGGGESSRQWERVGGGGTGRGGESPCQEIRAGVGSSLT
jgi:hypothetical protein